MGFGGIGIWQLLIVLAIIVLLFGTKKLKNIGGDLGGAIKGFKKAVSDEDKKAEADSINHQEKQESTNSDVQAKEKDKA
ncbi:Sec-independent protein translocase subunit TatA [Pseudoalteromonas sp. C2R02]|uniref:Sec-independent protein translocase subunit TatA n=1 Tax=Pseudoalteromonas sp. C2R02 TaxID=2841565 RepID=UPI001C09FFDF|nr:Sec-independent protein translocase subunit TatA [Pseudoalteromonas sp. C2R02]MBU2971121.1 Sec-independent protein translocase subunit TatA [Pseudoalteromonas sp. C2R02]